MVRLMTEVLEEDAKKIAEDGEAAEGKSCARAIGEALARGAMQGDIKAAAMLMELAGADFRSRDSLEKHEIDRQKLNLGRGEAGGIVIQDFRPEDGEVMA